MKDIVFPVCAVLSWTALLYKAWNARRTSRAPALVSLLVLFALLGTSFTLATPAVAQAFDQLAGVPNLAALCIHSTVIAFCATVQVTILYWAHPPAQAWPKARWRLLTIGLVLPIMATLFVVADTKERVPNFFQQYTHQPLVAAYATLYLITLIAAHVGLAQLGLRYAKLADQPWLRRGLRILTGAAATSLLHCAVRIADVVAAQVGIDASPWAILVPIFVGTSVFLGFIGVTVPVWGPRLSNLRHWTRQYRAYHRLYPLWNALYRAIPDIALDPPTSALADRLILRDIDFRLYRRVIEIRDGQRELRPWLDPAVASAAARLGRQANLTNHELDATIEAAKLAAALKRVRKDDSNPPGSAYADADIHGGPDLSTEIDWLIQVTRAFTNSPTVRRAVSEATNANDTVSPTT